MADIDITVGSCHRCRGPMAEGDILCATCAKDELSAFAGTISVPVAEPRPDAPPPRRLFGRHRETVEPAVVDAPPTSHLRTNSEPEATLVATAILGASPVDDVAADSQAGDDATLHVLALAGTVLDEPPPDALDGPEMLDDRIAETEVDETEVDETEVDETEVAEATTGYSPGSTAAPAEDVRAQSGLAAVIASAFADAPPSPTVDELDVGESAVSPDEGGEPTAELDEAVDAAAGDPAAGDHVAEPLAAQGYDFNRFALPASWLETKPAWYELEAAAESAAATEPADSTPRSRRLRHRMLIRLLLVVAFATGIMVLVGLWSGDDGSDPDVTITSEGVPIDDRAPPSTARPPAEHPASREDSSAETTASIPPTSPSNPTAGSGTASPAPAPTVAAPSVSTPAPAPPPPPATSAPATSAPPTTVGHGNSGGTNGGGNGNAGGGNGGGGKK